jgi:hypothetical protein
MKWVRELVRACLAGTVMHFGLMAACTSGTGGSSSMLGKGDTSGALERSALSIAEAHAAASGSRLKARWYVAADGARQFASFHDSELKQDCEFSLASDGVVRCLPKFVFSSPFFLDSACTERVIWDSICGIPQGAPVAFALPVPANDCGGNPSVRYDTRYYTAGEEVKPNVLYQSGPAGCTESTVFHAGVYRRLSPEIPAPSFVAAKLQD